MADLDDEDPRISYTAAGGETTFDFPWLVYTDSGGSSSHLKVVRIRSGTALELTVGTHYTVAGLDVEAGGTITLIGSATPAVAGDIYILYRELPIETFFSFATGGDYYATNVNKGNNLYLQIAQQLRLMIRRSAALPAGVAMESLALPSPESLKFLRWNTAATALENASGTGSGGGTDELVKVSSNDTNARYLIQKLVAGTGCTLTEQNNGADESILIAFATNPALAGYTETVDLHGSAAVGATETINVSTANVHKIILDVNCALTFSGAPVAGICASFTLYAVQDASGGNTLTYPASVKWPGGVAPTLATGANAVNVLAFSSIDGGTSWQGYVGGVNFA